MLTTLGRNQDIATWSFEHRRHGVPAVPHHLDDQRVGERRHQRLRAVGQVGCRVAVPGQPAQLGARPDLRLPQPCRRPALRRALQAARRPDLPALRERVPHHRGGGVAPPAVQRRPPGEPVDRLQHGLLPDGDVEPGGDLERTPDVRRAGVRRADHEDRRVTLRELTMRIWRGGIDAVSVRPGRGGSGGWGGRGRWCGHDGTRAVAAGHLGSSDRIVRVSPVPYSPAPTTYAVSVPRCLPGGRPPVPRRWPMADDGRRLRCVALCLAGVALCLGMTGCAQFNKALGQQQALIYFKTSTPVSFKLKVRAACDNLPHVKAAPIATSVPLGGRAVIYRGRRRRITPTCARLAGMPVQVPPREQARRSQVLGIDVHDPSARRGVSLAAGRNSRRPQWSGPDRGLVTTVAALFPTFPVWYIVLL